MLGWRVQGVMVASSGCEGGEFRVDSSGCDGGEFRV